MYSVCEQVYKDDLVDKGLHLESNAQERNTDTSARRAFLRLVKISLAGKTYAATEHHASSVIFR